MEQRLWKKWAKLYSRCFYQQHQDSPQKAPTQGWRIRSEIVEQQGSTSSLESCNFESYQADDGPVPFNVREPNGNYKLYLENPYDRMVAKQLQTLAYTPSVLMLRACKTVFFCGMPTAASTLDLLINWSTS